MLTDISAVGSPSQPDHLLNKYNAITPVPATTYAHDARAVIKDILARNKTPVIEGGSPFYINQIFNPHLSNFNDDNFHEARRVAKRIIELDGFNFPKTFARVSEILKKTGVPEQELGKIGVNDFYRLESKMSFALYLQSKGMSYSTFQA